MDLTGDIAFVIYQIIFGALMIIFNKPGSRHAERVTGVSYGSFRVGYYLMGIVFIILGVGAIIGRIFWP